MTLVLMFAILKWTGSIYTSWWWMLPLPLLEGGLAHVVKKLIARKL